MENITNTVRRMKAIAERLIPFTYPVASFEEEQEIFCLKQSAIWLDGYQVIVTFSRAQYDGHFLDSVQLQSGNALFLPFNLVCKIGRVFLGSDNLAYVDFFKNNRKIYCWTVKTLDDERTVAPGDKTKEANFEGFNFRVIEPGSINIF